MVLALGGGAIVVTSVTIGFQAVVAHVEHLASEGLCHDSLPTLSRLNSLSPVRIPSTGHSYCM